MNISFSKDEYARLIEAVDLMSSYIGETENADEEKWKKQVIELEQKLLSKAADFECGDAVEYEPELQAWFIKEDSGSASIGDLMAERDQENAFWTELADELALRDFSEAISTEELDALPLEDRLSQHSSHANTYLKHFEASGLSDLRLVEGSYSPKDEDPQD